MADKKGSVVADKKGSVVGDKKSSVRGSVAAAALGGGDAASALGLTPEVWFDSKKEEALAAKEAQDRLEIRALPVRQYLEASVVPLLLHGLQLLAIERPEDPVDFLARYLIEKNPMSQKAPLKEDKEEKKEEKQEEKKEEKKEEEKEENKANRE